MVVMIAELALLVALVVVVAFIVTDLRHHN
jgi:hypothetical protein